MQNPVAAKLQNRIAEQREAIETFAHLHRELTAIRDGIRLSDAMDHVDTLLTLNAEALRTTQDNLAVSIALLRSAHAAPRSVVAVE